MQSKNITRVALITALLLLIPFIAMQFSSEVNWTLGDFIFAGVLLFGTGIAYEFLVTRARNGVYKAAAAGAVLTALLLTWMNLAVGIIGNENNPVNLMFFAVPLIGIAGASIARLEARGMASTLVVTAVVQALIPVLALLLSRTEFSPGVVQIFGLNAFFVMLWLGSALLFQHAARMK